MGDGGSDSRDREASVTMVGQRMQVLTRDGESMKAAVQCYSIVQHETSRDSNSVGNAQTAKKGVTPHWDTMRCSEYGGRIAAKPVEEILRRYFDRRGKPRGVIGPDDSVA